MLSDQAYNELDLNLCYNRLGELQDIIDLHNMFQSLLHRPVS